MKTDVSPLDPISGPSIPFRRVGKCWFLGNRPARVASEIVEIDGRIEVRELDDTGVTVLQDKAA